MNAARKRILLRGARSLAALVIGGGITAASSSDFRDFVGDGPWAVFVLALVPPAVQMLGKWQRELRNQ